MPEILLLLTPDERDFVNGTKEFSKSKQRYLRHRINQKKRRLLNPEKEESNCRFNAGAEEGNGRFNAGVTASLEPTCPFGHGSSSFNIISTNPKHTERGSPSPVSVIRGTGGNLVGRGIANPMSERTRGFEMS